MCLGDFDLATSIPEKDTLIEPRDLKGTGVEGTGVESEEMPELRLGPLRRGSFLVMQGREQSSSPLSGF